MNVTFHEPSHPMLYRGASILKYLLLLPRSLFRLKHVIIRGVSVDGDPHFCMHYIGEGESLNYLKYLCFLRIEFEHTYPCHIGQIESRLRNIKVDFVIVEINRLLSSFTPDYGFETYAWIRQKIVFQDDIWLKRKSYINGKLTRKVRKHKYRFEMTTDKQKLKTFYNKLYSPYIHYRYGSAVHLRSFGEIRATMKKGFILQIFDGDLWVAGVICRTQNKEVVSFAMGLLPDHVYHLRRGALLAAYHFLVNWAIENGMETVDLLRSRPHAEDGVYEHKRLWGAKAVKDSWPHTLIKQFIPIGGQIPSPLRRLLVWNGHEFAELNKVFMNRRCV